jgi:6-phosphogluconolactonase
VDGSLDPLTGRDLTERRPRPPSVFDDVESLARHAAEVVRQQARGAIAERGEFRLGLPGGDSPTLMLAALASDPSTIDWARTTVLFTDERAVAPDHPDSNYRRIRETLLDRLATTVAPPRVLRMEAAAQDLERAARIYETHLVIPLDLLVLGLGSDGHVASLFPGHAALNENVRHVIAVFDSPKPPARRLTIAPPVIREARRAMVLALGSAKAPAVAQALAPGEAASPRPGRWLRQADWLIDRTAAAGL